jgi:hypothetical protein
VTHVKTVTATPTPTSNNPLRSTDGSFDASANQACLGAQLVLKRAQSDTSYAKGLQILTDAIKASTAALDSGQTAVHAASMSLVSPPVTDPIKIAQTIFDACASAGWKVPVSG